MAKSRMQPGDALRLFALEFPEAYEDFPWGTPVVKVRKKVFIFLGTDETPGFSMSVKLPESGTDVLDEPFAEPTGYGLGKSGWVSVKFPASKVPVKRARAWIEESYRAVAPKTLVRQLDGDEPPKAKRRTPRG